MKDLKGSQKKYLKKLAHSLNPVVMVGQGGVTDGVIEKVDASLDSHELIKIRFLEFKKDKRRLAEDIARRTESVCVDIIGHVAILYKSHPDDAERKIVLPDG